MNHSQAACIRRRGISYILLTTTLLLGVPSLRHTTWHINAEFHTLLETIATLLALIAGSIALVRYYAKRSDTFLVLGSGLLGTSLLDGYHALITSSFLVGHTRSSLLSLMPWSGVTSRLFLSLVMYASLLAWKREVRSASTRPLNERAVYFTMGASTTVLFLFFTLVPLPPMSHPNWFIHQPVDLIPAVLFGLAAAGYLRKGEWRADDFEHWLVISLSVAVTCQFYGVFFQRMFYGRWSVFHLLKIASYASVLVGLFISMFSIFKNEAENTAHLRSTNQSLEAEIAKRKEMEQELHRAHDELEARVKERTADLAQTNRTLQLEVAERGRAEAQRARLATAIEQAAEGVVVTDPEGSIQYINPAFTTITGYTEAEVIGRNPRLLKSGKHESGFYADLWKTVLAGETWRGEVINRRKDGSLYSEAMSITPVRDAHGAIAGFTAIKQDITERKRLEVELRHAQKLEAVGGLAAGIAHELNTPIQFVGDNTHFLKGAFADLTRVIENYHQLRDAADNGGTSAALVEEVKQAEQTADLDYLMEEIPRALEQSLDGVTRVATIVRAMKEFAHPDRSEKMATDLNKALESTLIVARNEIKYVADVETDFAELPLVQCHGSDINQVFLNLLVNAAHAIKDVAKGGEKKGLIRVQTCQEEQSVLISISDTGCGIPEEIREKIFEPFFTTKEVGVGTGQGLAIARSIVVDKHGGSLTLDTEVGCGTTFHIRLPVGSGSEGEFA